MQSASPNPLLRLCVSFAWKRRYGFTASTPGGPCNAKALVSTTSTSITRRRLRGGDELAFAQLVDRHTPVDAAGGAGGTSPIMRSPKKWVQETWLALLRGIDTFRGSIIFVHLTFRGDDQHRKGRRCGRERPRCRRGHPRLYTWRQPSNPARFRTGEDPVARASVGWPRTRCVPGNSEGSVLGNELVDIVRRETRRTPVCSSSVKACEPSARSVTTSASPAFRSRLLGAFKDFR